MLLSVILSLVVLVIPQVACASESVHQSSSSKAAHLFKRAAAGWTAPGAIAHTGHHGKRQPDLLDDLKTHSLAEIAGVEPDESGSYANHGQYYYHSSSPKGRRQLLAVAENSIPAAQDVVHRDNGILRLISPAKPPELTSQKLYGPHSGWLWCVFSYSLPSLFISFTEILFSYWRHLRPGQLFFSRSTATRSQII